MPRAKAKPALENDATVEIDGRQVKLTNLNKVFWPKQGYTKRDLLNYYTSVSKWLLPHIVDRAMVLKRYPNGIDGDFFFMKRVPDPHPEWLKSCTIEHSDGPVTFPMVDDLASLLYIINLGCIDLNQWYGTCDHPRQPDYLHFDLDPGTAKWESVCEAALLVRDGLKALKMPCYAKTSGSKGIHIYIPIKRGPDSSDVQGVSKEIAHTLAAHAPELLTVIYRKEKRPKGRVLVDYNQNRFGSTLASIYSVRPNDFAGVSTPVTFEEIEAGIEIEDFRLDNIVPRLEKIGDLWKPLLAKSKRYDLSAMLA